MWSRWETFEWLEFRSSIQSQGRGGSRNLRWRGACVHWPRSPGQGSWGDSATRKISKTSHKGEVSPPRWIRAWYKVMCWVTFKASCQIESVSVSESNTPSFSESVLFSVVGFYSHLSLPPDQCLSIVLPSHQLSLFLFLALSVPISCALDYHPCQSWRLKLKNLT